MFLQMIGSANAGEPCADDQDVKMFQRHGLLYVDLHCFVAGELLQNDVAFVFNVFVNTNICCVVAENRGRL